MRLARIAHPDGVAFVAVDGPDGAGRREIEDHPFGTPTFTGRSLAAGRHPAAGADPAVEGGRDRPELRRPRRRARQRACPTTPMIFLKPSTSVIGPQRADPAAGVRRTGSTTRASWPSSSAGRAGTCKAENASSVILGYTVANDVTARDQQQADVQFTRAKGYDTFCPLGPWIETELDPSDLAVRTELDGERGAGRHAPPTWSSPSARSSSSSPRS